MKDNCVISSKGFTGRSITFEVEGDVGAGGANFSSAGGGDDSYGGDEDDSDGGGADSVGADGRGADNDDGVYSCTSCAGLEVMAAYSVIAALKYKRPFCLVDPRVHCSFLKFLVYCT